MPRLSFFYGIAIYLYYEYHPPPHISRPLRRRRSQGRHRNRRDHRGIAPPPRFPLVAEWVSEHGDELTACWEKATSGEEPGTIEPLK